MATADCGCILTLYLILWRRCAPRSTCEGTLGRVKRRPNRADKRGGHTASNAVCPPHLSRHPNLRPGRPMYPRLRENALLNVL